VIVMSGGKTSLAETVYRRATDGPDFVQARFGTARGLARLWLAQAARATGRLRQFECIDWSRVSRLVFVCRGNICRSAYAEKKTTSLGYPAASFGLSADSGLPADEQAQAAAIRRGVQLQGHRSCGADDFELRQGDLLAAMEVRQLDEIMERFGNDSHFQLTLTGLWSHPRRPHLHDPLNLCPAYFETCFGIIDSAIDTLLAKLKTPRM
jgi:protein-tyrosine phosphatase